MDKIIIIQEVDGVLKFDSKNFTGIEVIGIMAFYKERYIRLANEGTTTEDLTEERSK